tara:strand:+ start:2871 stop:3209 length:339 start_codon:yes stop_codon:yes gene_type:complete
MLRAEDLRYAMRSRRHLWREEDCFDFGDEVGEERFVYRNGAESDPGTRGMVAASRESMQGWAQSRHYVDLTDRQVADIDAIGRDHGDEPYPVLIRRLDRAASAETRELLKRL